MRRADTLSPTGRFDTDYIRQLDRANTRTIDRTGGTVLHTSRTNPAKMSAKRLPAQLADTDASRFQTGEDLYDLTPIVLDNIEYLGLDYLITIGGDDTLSYAKVLDRRGVPLIAIPKTMDNDVQGTEYCIGFSSAVTRAKELINRQRTSLGSHERIGVFRIFGRESGFTALFAAYVTSARCVIPEAPFDLDRLLEILVEDKRLNPSRYAFVIASEGAIWRGGSVGEFGEADAYGHRRKVDIGFALAEQIKARTGEEAVNSELTYDLRSGEADSLDTMVAITFANIAVDLIRDGVRSWPDDRHRRRQVRLRRYPGAGQSAAGGRELDVRPGSVPAAVPRPHGTAAATRFARGLASPYRLIHVGSRLRRLSSPPPRDRGYSR